MATINYNPQAQDLQLGWKPTGFLGGMLAQQQQQRADTMNPLYDYMTGLDAQKQAYGLQDYLAQRDSANQAKIAQNTATAQTAIPEAQANLSLNQDKTTLSRQTLHSRIATQIADEAVKQGDDGLLQLDQATGKAALLASTIPSNTAGPAAEAQLRGLFASHGIDADNDPVAKYILSAGPGNYQAAANHIHNIYDEASAKARQTRDIEGMRVAGQAQVAGIRGQYEVQAAQVRAQAKNKSYAQQIQMIKTPEQAFTMALTILNDPEVTDGRLKAWATGEYQSLLGYMQNKSKKGLIPEIPGLPVIQPPAFPVPQNPANPAAPQTQPQVNPNNGVIHLP